MEYQFNVVVRYPSVTATPEDIQFVITEYGQDAFILRENLLDELAFIYPGADFFVWLVEDKKEKE